jgi:hypothetical protein
MKREDLSDESGAEEGLVTTGRRSSPSQTGKKKKKKRRESERKLTITMGMMVWGVRGDWNEPTRMVEIIRGN